MPALPGALFQCEQQATFIPAGMLQHHAPVRVGGWRACSCCCLPASLCLLPPARLATATCALQRRSHARVLARRAFRTASITPRPTPDRSIMMGAHPRRPANANHAPRNVARNPNSRPHGPTLRCTLRFTCCWPIQMAATWRVLHRWRGAMPPCNRFPLVIRPYGCIAAGHRPWPETRHANGSPAGQNAPAPSVCSHRLE